MNRVTYTHIAVVAATLGGLFMVAVAINLGWRYGVTWSFDPQHNSQIAVFIGSIAGALFTLTNALLLFATLKAQRNAQKDANDQHRELRQDRNYDRLATMAERLEQGIGAFTYTEDQPLPKAGERPRTYSGYFGFALTFEAWVKQITLLPLEFSMEMRDHIDPEMFLTQQSEVMDLMFQLNTLVQTFKAKDLDPQGRAHLDEWATNILTRLSRSKWNIERAASLLRKFVDEGGSIHPKQAYASDLLHLERKLRNIASILPDMPHRQLSPFAESKARLTDKAPVAMFESDVVPNFQVDGVTYHTNDPDWVLRFNAGRLTIQVVALDGSGEELNYYFQTFSFSMLLYETKERTNSFDTKGAWFVEGSYNLLGGHVEDHKRWRIDVGIVDMELLPGESLELTIYTNAKRVEGVEPIKQL